MHTFTKTKDPTNKFDHIDASITTGSEDIHNVINAFETYLYAAGFRFGGRHLELVPENYVEDSLNETIT